MGGGVGRRRGSRGMDAGMYKTEDLICGFIMLMRCLMGMLYTLEPIQYLHIISIEKRMVFLSW